MFGDWGGCMTFTLMASIFSMCCTDVLGINATLMLGEQKTAMGKPNLLKMVVTMLTNKAVGE